jgi:hypothetical protein
VPLRTKWNANMPWKLSNHGKVLEFLGVEENRGLVLFGAGGGSRTHFSHPFLDAYYGLLRDVSAARRLSRSAFGGRCQPRPLAPGDLDRVCQNCISLLRTGELLAIEVVVRVVLGPKGSCCPSIRVSRSILALLLVLRLLLCEC